MYVVCGLEREAGFIDSEKEVRIQWVIAFYGGQVCPSIRSQVIARVEKAWILQLEAFA